MTKLVLDPADRKRYDLPDEIEYERGMFGRKSIAELKRQTGYTLDRLSAGLRGILKAQPDGTEILERDDVAAVAFVWLVLFDNGHRISWNDFDLRGSIDFSADDPEDEEQGKAPDPDTSNTTTTDPA